MVLTIKRMNIKRTRQLFLVFVTSILLMSCSLLAQTQNISTDIPVAPSQTNTITQTPTFTNTPEPTQTPTVTPTNTPTPHPMSIEALRQKTFPGSQIVIENELEAGSNYKRFYAYYLSEGLKIYGLLTIPNGEPPQNGWPAIVFNHGYIPPDVYRTTERYIAYVDWLARSQYVVFRIDYRGHDRSEGEARGAYGDPGYITDVLNAVSSLQQYPAVNPDKIGMWGHSLGGYLTLRAMVVSPDIQAGVIWAGVVASYPDLISKWRRPSSAPQPTRPSFCPQLAPGMDRNLRLTGGEPRLLGCCFFQYLCSRHLRSTAITPRHGRYGCSIGIFTVVIPGNFRCERDGGALHIRRG